MSCFFVGDWVWRDCVAEKRQEKRMAKNGPQVQRSSGWEIHGEREDEDRERVCAWRGLFVHLDGSS